jgi:GAF domain-containing protein
MDSNKTRPTTVHEQIHTLGLQAGKLRDALKQKKVRDLPSNVLDDLGNLAGTLSKIGQQMEAFEAQHGNLLALANIGQVINSSLELDEVLRIVMDNIVQLTHAERGYLMLRDEKGQMVTRVARNWEQESIKSNEAATSRTIVQRVIDSGEPIVTTNAQEDQRFVGKESIVALNLRSILCVPLKVKNDLIGVIYADNRIRTGIFAETERDLLVAFANQAAVAIGQRVRLHRQRRDHRQRRESDHACQPRRTIHFGTHRDGHRRPSAGRGAGFRFEGDPTAPGRGAQDR